MRPKEIATTKNNYSQSNRHEFQDSESEKELEEGVGGRKRESPTVGVCLRGE